MPASHYLCPSVRFLSKLLSHQHRKAHHLEKIQGVYIVRARGQDDALTYLKDHDPNHNCARTTFSIEDKEKYHSYDSPALAADAGETGGNTHTSVSTERWTIYRPPVGLVLAADKSLRAATGHCPTRRTVQA